MLVSNISIRPFQIKKEQYKSNNQETFSHQKVQYKSSNQETFSHQKEQYKSSNQDICTKQLYPQQIKLLEDYSRVHKFRPVQ
jgi:hypothetical protein